MNKQNVLGVLACAATAAIAAGNVSNALYWDGTTDTGGRVETGSDDDMAGYWYEFTDENDGGTSRFTYPSEIEENEYGNFFGPLVEAYGGIKAHVMLGDGYDYPYAGVGFNVWNAEQDGADISSWGGIIIGYESTLGFVAEIGVEDERNVTEYDNYWASVTKAPSGNQIVLPWSKFRQGGWGRTADLNYVLAHANAIKLKFQGAAGTSGNFRITSIRSIEGSPDTVSTPRPDTTIIVPPDTTVVPPPDTTVIPPVISPISRFTSDTLYWDGSVDTEGRVETGSDDLTAGYWYEYTDENDAGTSKFIYPSDVEENEYGNFYGPLVEQYGGIKARASLGDGYEYPYVGLGFNIWNEDQDAVNVSSWGGLVLTYESTGSFVLEIVTDDEKYYGYDNYKVAVPKCSSTCEFVAPWSVFRQSGWGNSYAIGATIGHVAAIRIKFEGNAGTNIDFRITKIRSITKGSGTVVPPTPIVKDFVSNSLFWDGAKDDEGRVNTGSDDLTSGYWYEETDEGEHGHSKFVWPANVHENEYGNFFGPLVEAYDGVKGRVKLNKGARHPYASLGFNVWSEKQEGVDVSSWGGLVIEYESTIDFSVELVTDGNKKDSYYGTYTASAPKSRNHVRQLVLPWSKFKRSTGWGFSVNKTSALKHIAAVKFKFEGRAGTVGDFRITKIRSIHGSAAAFYKPASSDLMAVKPVSLPTDSKAILAGRTLSLQGITDGKVQVLNLRGQVVKSATAGSSMDLSSLNAGVYMVRVVGKSVKFAQKISLE